MPPKMEPKWSHSEPISSNILVPGATLGTNRLQVASQTSLFMILEPRGPIFHDFRSCFVCFSDMFVFPTLIPFRRNTYVQHLPELP